MSGRIPYEKYASGFHIPELIERAHLVAQGDNTHPEQVDAIPTYDYYESPIQIGEKPYTAHIRVRNTRMGDKYYGHTISEVDDIKIEPSARTSVPGEPPAVQPVNAIDGSKNSIPQTTPAVKAPTKTPAQLAREARVLDGLPLVDHLGSFGRTGLTHLLESHGAVGDAEASWNVIDGYMDLYLAGFDRRPVSQDILPADATPAARRLTAPERLQAYYNGLNDAGVMGQDRTEWGTTQTPGDLESGEDIQESERGDKARHVGKSILSGGRTTGFEGLTEDMRQAFREGLKTASPETQKLLRQWKRKAQYRLAPSKRSYYRTSKGVITIGRNATASTVAHELFHWVDDGGRISSQLLDPLMQDYVALKMASEGSVKEYLIDRFPEAFKMRGKKRQTMVMRSEYRGISDVLNGLSGGKEHYGYGHSKKYWERAGALEAEAWAQLGRHLYENMDMPLQMFQELFPNLYRSAIIKLKELK